MLTKAQILAACDVIAEEVDVPEWGGKARVRVMRGTDRDSLAAAIHKATADDAGTFNYRLNLLQRTVVDEDGLPLFGVDELEMLNDKSTSALDRLFEVADRLNSAGSKAVDAAEKN